MRNAEMAREYARRVVLALIGPTNRGRDDVADRILDDLREVVINVSGTPSDMKIITMTMTIQRAVAEEVLRAVAIPDPPTDPEREGHWVDGPTSKLCPAHGLHPHVGPTGDVRRCTECPFCLTAPDDPDHGTITLHTDNRAGTYAPTLPLTPVIKSGDE